MFATNAWDPSFAHLILWNFLVCNYFTARFPSKFEFSPLKAEINKQPKAKDEQQESFLGKRKLKSRPRLWDTHQGSRLAWMWWLEPKINTEKPDNKCKIIKRQILLLFFCFFVNLFHKSKSFNCILDVFILILWLSNIPFCCTIQYLIYYYK